MSELGEKDDASSRIAAAKRAFQQLSPSDEALERMLVRLSAQPPSPSQSSGWRRCLAQRAAWGVAGLSVVGLMWGALQLRPSVPEPAAPAHRPESSLPTATRSLSEASVAEPRPTREPAAVAPPAAVQADAPVARTRTAKRVQVDDPVAELALLTRARRLLPSAPERTLSLTSEHAQLYPRGALREERELLAIEALSALRRTRELERRASSFARTFQGSVHLQRVRALANGHVD